jgi:hypothetical protein
MPRPYGNNADCSWVYDNGSPGLAFHFSLLDTEKDFDYVHVEDADGNVLATYKGHLPPSDHLAVHPDEHWCGALHVRFRGHGPGVHRGHGGTLLREAHLPAV